MITIRHSLPKDLDAIIEIFHYARQFMKEHGNPNQWINGYPSAELILREITNGTNYVCNIVSDSFSLSSSVFLSGSNSNNSSDLICSTMLLSI